MIDAMTLALFDFAPTFDAAVRGACRDLYETMRPDEVRYAAAGSMALLVAWFEGMDGVTLLDSRGVPLR